MRALVFKAASFGLVGLANFAVDLGLFSFLYYYLGLPIISANMMSWFVAVGGSYIMNSQVTFAAESGGQLRLDAYGKFVLAQLGGLLANTATVLAASHFMPVLMGKFLAVGTSFLVNFLLSHFVVFRTRQQTSAP
jgi:putative flippase GtrA